MWCDQRTYKQCVEATEKLGGEKNVLKRVGNPILEGFTLPKILWLKENEPFNYRRINKIILPKDYIVFKLTGNIGTNILMLQAQHALILQQIIGILS